MSNLFTVRISRITNPNTLEKKTIFVTTDVGLVWKAVTPGTASSEYTRVIDKRTYCTKAYNE